MQTTTKRFAAWCAFALSLLALGSGCLGTPLPDPPSFSGEMITLSDSTQPGTIRLVGRPGTLRDASVPLRVTAPPTPGVLVASNPDGSFGRIVPGAAGVRIFFELILADEDRFVGAFMAPLGGSLVRVDPGPDADGDGSPDLIDCAPADRALGGQRCVPAPACAVDSDCSAGQICDAPVCVVMVTCTIDSECGGGACLMGVCRGTPVCHPVAETCNGTDDDCNGLIDDGDPGGGVPCTAADRCPGTIMCGAMPMCVSAGPRAEVCGNAIDDDCNGVVDDGC